MKKFFSRRNVIFTLCVLTLVSAVVIFGSYAMGYIKNHSSGSHRSAIAMDCPVTLSVYGKKSTESITQKAADIVNNTDNTLSAYKENSEIYLLNKNKILENPSNLTRNVLLKSTELCKQYKNVDITAGNLINLWGITSDNPKVPSSQEITDALKTVGIENLVSEKNGFSLKNNTQIDLGSLAKGYCCDLLCDYFNSQYNKNKIDYAIVSFGSSTLLFGQRQQGNFKVAVKSPDNPNRIALTFETSACCVSTSGGYERFFTVGSQQFIHIFNLKDGYPSHSDLTSVTVVCKGEDKGIKSDFLSTEIFIGGSKNLYKYNNIPDTCYIAIDALGKIYTNADFNINIEDKRFFMNENN